MPMAQRTGGDERHDPRAACLAQQVGLGVGYDDQYEANLPARPPIEANRKWIG